MAGMSGRVALVGAGLIGRGWATVFARAGAEAVLWDPVEGAAEAAKCHVWQALDDLAEAGLLSIADANTAKPRVKVAATLADAVAGAVWVQENAPEKRDAKQALFAEIDAAAPPAAILASSTSTFPGSTFFGHVPGRARCLVAHPANPPHLMPVVEIVPADFTDPEVVIRARGIMAAVGQVPVLVKQEIEGFVMNRLQAAVIAEAMSLVARDVIAPDDLDAVMKHSLGLRWSFMGPFETIDLNAPGGVPDYVARYGPALRGLAADLRMTDEWTAAAVDRITGDRRARVPREKLGDRSLWRDRRLMRLLREKEKSDRELGR